MKLPGLTRHLKRFYINTSLLIVIRDKHPEMEDSEKYRWFLSAIIYNQRTIYLIVTAQSSKKFITYFEQVPRVLNVIWNGWIGKEWCNRISRPLSVQENRCDWRWISSFCGTHETIMLLFLRVGECTDTNEDCILSVAKYMDEASKDGVKQNSVILSW